MTITLFDIIYVLILTGVFTYLDRKYEWARLKYIYNKNIWIDILMNLLFFTGVTVIAKLIFKY